MQNNFGRKLKELRKENNITQGELAKMLHLSDKSSISRYEKGENRPALDVLKRIADVFNVTVDYLLEIEPNDIFTENELVRVPVYRDFRGGTVNYEYIHQEELILGREYFFLIVKDDTMVNARIYEGDKVLIMKQSYIERNGDIMLVEVEKKAILRRVYKQAEGYVLQCDNNKYPPAFYKQINIIGKAIEVKIKL